MKTPLLAASLALALMACEQQATTPATDTAQPEVSGPQEQTAQPAVAGPPTEDGAIDWAAARADRAASPAADQASVSVQSVTGDAPGPPAVPILLPSGIVQVQGADARPPALVATDDGYFANYRMAKWDAVVNGSKRAYVTGEAPAANAGEMKFTVSDASAQMAFTRYGADYLIEFECRQLDGALGCITEEEARDFANSLFVAQTQ